MRIALVNPAWSFEHSIYFGCRDPHLPLELAYARALLAAAGHDVIMVDAHLFGQTNTAAADEVAAFAPDMTVVTTAPTYLFWRCAPPELRVPREFLDALGERGGRRIAVGPHGSVTPQAALRKLAADIVVRGECEGALAAIAAAGDDLHGVAGIAFHDGRRAVVTGGPQAVPFVDAPALAWPPEWIERHVHHHHRFDAHIGGPAAEIEASRGCPFNCTFCAKIDYRDKYRRRHLPLLLEELDGLIRGGVRYVYFIDEIFLPNEPLLAALRARDIAFGIQTRIDLWKPEQIDRLGEAGCVSIEAGLESLTSEGRASLAKKCRLSTEELAALLIRARERVPFVQANLIATAGDDAHLVAEWRDRLQRHGVWANDPVPLYPYPSSPDYRLLFGEPDEFAWERAQAYYLRQFDRFSEIQDERLLPLSELEATCH